MTLPGRDSVLQDFGFLWIHIFENLVSLSQGGGDLLVKLIFGDPHRVGCIDPQNILMTLPGREPVL